ncbi:VaFE repeat-containing surface-anchored protein [Corynebacterium flavescens]|uniref:VaFE repeat-containing surface-anchored protein n=1 Tax=Corynebacterium flavescens TaxID=28028 RepID=UPI003FD26BA6
MEKSVKTMRGGGIKRIAALVMSGFIALSGAQLVNSATAQAQEAPYNPIASYTDYNVVSFGDLHIKAESEGAVAVGGKFSFTDANTIIKKQAPVALVVKGGVDWEKSTGTHQVNPQGFVSGNPLSVNLEGSQALDKDSNGANVQVNVVPQGAGYGNDPRIQLNDNGPKADSVSYDGAKYDSLFDKNLATTASEKLDQESKKECQAPFTLKKVESQNNLPAGTEPPAYFMQGGGSQAWLYLKPGQQNILNLTAEELSKISEFQIKGAPISKDTPLFINVAGETVNLPASSFDVAVAPYILWNLPQATTVTQSGDSLRGSLLAPKANLDKTNANIDGTVIVDSGDMKGSEQHYAPFQGAFTPCGDEPTPPKPEIATNAGAEGEHDVKVISADGGTLVDQVAYSGLVPSKEYTLEGEIHDPQGKATGITAKTTFTPAEATGRVEVKFEITAANATKYAGKSLVVYETLKEGKGGEGSEPIVEHHNPNDKAQTFKIEEKPTPVEPLIGTSAEVQGAENVKVLPVSGGTVVDTVSYENLKPETEYTLAGELVHVGADNQVIEKTGITASGEFKTAAAADGESVVSGSAEVTFEISAEAAAKYAGEKLVVFETLSLDGEVVVTHEDPADVKQSFTVEEEKPTPGEPKIGTSAEVQGAENVKVLPVSGGTVVDTVSYENLKPETEYTLAGELVHVGADNQVIEKTGITASGEFKTAAAADGESVVSGSAEVTFEISAEAAAKYAGEKLVVFETLSLDGEVVVTHEDPADVKQSFTVEEEKPTPGEPKIGTSAEVQGAENVKVLPVSGGTVVDTVSYENLKPETEYTLAGELVHVGADNQVIEKTGITASGEFKTAAAADGESVVSGSAEVTFEISAEAAAKYAGEKLVVFETLSLDGEVVVTHEDPADVKQSFTVENKPPTTDVIVEKTVTGPKAGEINKDESAEFEITASWFDKDGVEQFKIFKVKPGQEVSVDGLPIDTEITLTESGALTKVKNVKWADIIWSGAGVTAGTGASKSATITLDGKGTQKIDLENKTGANGLIIIPIPLPGLPNVPGSSTPPGPNVPVTPGQPTEPVTPGQPTEPSKPGQPTEPGKPGPSASSGSKESGLANTGADVMLLAGGALLLLLGGAWLVLRARKQES